MATPPPDIDQRSHSDIVRQTTALVESYTNWRSPNPKSLNGSPSDAGLALIRIFSHMAATVSDRLNRVSDRNLLAYINLIGAQLIPPQPARVPLSFKLAEGSPVDVLVPAHTQVAASATEEDKEPLIFETEQDLLVSSTQLKAMYVLEDRDYYSDRSDHLNATIANQKEAFLAFRGNIPVEHELYLNCDEVFNLPELTTVTITIDTDRPKSATQLQGRLQEWWVWQEKNWIPLSQVDTQVVRSQATVRLTQLPKLIPSEVNGVKAKWLRVSLVAHRRESLPEITQIQTQASLNQVHIPNTCLFNTSKLDLSKDFHPFGLTPLHNDTFAIQLNSKFIKPNVAVEVQATLSHTPIATSDLTLIWEIGNEQQWQPIGITPNEETPYWRNNLPLDFSQPALSATLQFPASLPTSEYWLRARIATGLYGTKGRERKYVLYNDVTLVAQTVTAGARSLIVDSVDELEIGDTIRLQSTTGEPRQEDATITRKNSTKKTLTLDREIRNAYEPGTRILSKFVMAESLADIFDPPLIQTLNLTYQFTLQRSANYLSYNDFNYCSSRSSHIRLTQSAVVGDRILHVDNVSQLALGEVLKFEDDRSEKRQIELIDSERKLVILTEPLAADHGRSCRLIQSFHPLTRSIHPDSALYLGFSKPFPNRPNTLYLQVDPPSPNEVAPTAQQGIRTTNGQRVIWEYPSPEGWKPLVSQDETQALEESGVVRFIGPTDFIPASYFGQSLYWLRIRKTPGDWDSIPFALLYLFNWVTRFQQVILYGMMRDLVIRVADSASILPRIRSVQTNTIWASQSITLANEILGSSNQNLNQVFSTTHVPILADQQLEVQEGKMPSDAEQSLIREQMGEDAIVPILNEAGRVETVWIRWQEMPDFSSSNPNDRHYVIDRQAGTIQFGDGQVGMIPPRGRNNIRLARYQIGGGNRGNRSAQTIAELKTTLPYLDSVINWEAAKGGNDQESLARLKERAPKQLRHRDRAVTAQDFEDLTYAASAEVARVKVITPEILVPNFNPLLEELWVEPGSPPPVSGNRIQVLQHDVRAGRVQVLIVPYSDDRQPTPTLALLNRVETFLRSRYVPTLRLRVSAPKWQEILIITELVPLSVANADSIRIAAEQRIQSFLHPLTGNNDGNGWSFGRRPHQSDLYAILEGVPGVSYVRSLKIHPETAIDQQTLIYCGPLVVTLKFPGA